MKKIRSKEELDAWAKENSYPVKSGNSVGYSLDSFNILKNHWYAQREKLRFNKEYRATKTLEYINSRVPIYAHISRDDKSMVAYTPNAACGANDTQVKTTIGKLLVKYFPILTEDEIVKLAAQHMAEANPVIKFLQGWELTDAYINSFGGIGACMSNSVKFSRETHPTIAYHTPKVSLACLMEGDTIKERTLVYHHSDTDKRIIRVYGGTTLKLALQDMGYSMGTFHGCQFNTVEFPNTRDTYIFPYLDGNGTAGNSSTSIVALIDKQITCITSDQGDLLKQHTIATNTKGKITLTNVPSTGFIYKSIVSGKEINLLLTKPSDVFFVYLPDGTQTPVECEYEDLFISAQISTDGEYGMARKEDCFIGMLRNYTNGYVLNTDTLKSAYIQLDKDLYPAGTLAQKSITNITQDGKVILDFDTVNVFNGTTYIELHESRVNTKEYIKTHNNVWITKDTPYLTTTSKRKVVEGVHTYYTTIEGNIVLKKPRYIQSIEGKIVCSNNYELFISTRDKLINEFLISRLDLAWNSNMIPRYDYFAPHIRLYRYNTWKEFYSVIVNFPVLHSHLTKLMAEATTSKETSNDPC